MEGAGVAPGPAGGGVAAGPEVRVVSGADTTMVVAAPPSRVVVTRVQPPRCVRTMPGRGSPTEFSAVMPPQ